MSRYSMGIDFGTLSGRAVIVNIDTGEEMAASVREYAHGVMADKFVNGKGLPTDFALQHPKDYLETLYFVIRDCLAKSCIDAADIVGVGVDFTACTILPVTREGTPLCFLEEYRENPHAYVKLWKHHAAQKEADEVNGLAREMEVEWLKHYGGAISSEWMLPKVLEIIREDEELYNETDRFVEAGDWIVWQLAGLESHSICTTGFKAAWNQETGYPDKEYLGRLDERLTNIVGDKLGTDIKKMSECAGYVTQEAAALTGLKEGTPVMPAFVDAHAALPALGITSPGKLLLIMGTSTCHILLGEKEIYVPGISGYVKDGIVDGYYAYEAGQACVGDCFDWFVKKCVPGSYFEEAKEQGVSIYTLLDRKASELGPGANGLLALDWWNGNRTPYGNSSLTGTLVGLSISTTPEEIYRALIEATAYGTRNIIEIYEENGIKIDTIYAAGGIPEKNTMLMQIYADVTGREIYLADTTQSCAYGSAVLGASSEGGYGDLAEASLHMKKVKEKYYRPIGENTEIYDKLYAEYKKLSAYFADGDNGVMETLREIKQSKKRVFSES